MIKHEKLLEADSGHCNGKVTNVNYQGLATGRLALVWSLVGKETLGSCRYHYKDVRYPKRQAAWNAISIHDLLF